MVRALEIYLTNPGAYRSGWPDLTVIRGDQLWLYEVKTTDRLNENQLRFLLDIAKPLGLGMTVLRLQPIPTDRQPSRRRWWPF
ncbi:hypothetical protein CKO28_01080 [Rhodovibrio sodomensis]|uniref:VRR-NUC domain-containing protein n=1 Tax=Rhodovibrio sodomensis TaxID=1088 RepID=A0ABS1D9R3_9PROT|nr:hypothetical protein [Rhodovibrio sodomensis]MBK1666636.1 hypothetical protein [Rhodovibrio sodomensis]